MKTYGYTLVQHSGWGYGGDARFRYGLESRTISTKRQLNQIKSVGGLVFDDYSSAEAEAMRLMYPEDHADGWLPRARGTFSSLTIDDLFLFVPSVKKEPVA